MLSLHWGQGLWLDYRKHSWLKSSSLAAVVQYVHGPFSDYWAKILGAGTPLYVCNIQVYCTQEWTRFQIFENNKSKLHWMEESGPDQSQNAFYHSVQDWLSSSLLVRNADMKIYKTVTLHRLEDNMKMDLKGSGEFMNWIHMTWNIEQWYAFWTL